LEDLFQLGPVVAKPHFFSRFLYGTGIQATPGQASSSAITSFSPGVLFVIGTHWTLDYTPTLTWYSSQQFHNSLDESVALHWGTYYEDWILGGSQNYTAGSDPLVETGAQTTTETYATSLNASYRFNSVMSIDLGVVQSITAADQLNSSKSWSLSDWLNYQFWPRLSGSIGTVFGYDNVNYGPDMTHEDLQGRLTWRVAGKLSLVANAGAEDRQFLGAGVPDAISPVYGASIIYQPLQYTTMTLNANRSVSTSPFQNEVTDSATLSLGLEQRLLQRFKLNLTGGYNTVNFESTTAGVPTTRQDELYSFNTRFSWEFIKHTTAAVTYGYTKNSSKQEGFGFSSSQVGIELSYKY
jgi:hypothetical protein